MLALGYAPYHADEFVPRLKSLKCALDNHCALLRPMSLSYFSGFDPSPQASLLNDADPEYLQAATPSQMGVICLHGFTGVPFEVMPVAKGCQAAGIDAVVPLLPGHGYRDRDQQRQQFAAITPEIMFQAARQEIERARERYEKVAMFGFSMGGAIALKMAAEGRLAACAVGAPALRLIWQAELLIPLLGWASFTLEAPRSEDFYIPGYEFHHSRALRTLWQIGRRARAELSHIHCPLLAVHSHSDATIPAIATEHLQRQIPVDIEVAWFDRSNHCLALDVEAEAVVQQVTHFFQRQLG